LSPLDRQRLDAALDLATRAIGLSDPNPRVGCLIGTADGRILGQGHTQQAGGPHAEVMALRDARSQGNDVRGATAWVTLEPCAHHGRTPPCADALVEAGLARVVVAIQDPFPSVAGQGLERLRAAGIAVELADDDLATRARELNIGFFSRIERGRPWVRLKVACSLDGFTALPDGRSQWITGPEARADGHAWRRRAGAIVTGVGTVLADDPRMDVRLVPTTLQPWRIVVDSTWRAPLSARVFQPPGRVAVALAETDSARVSEAGSAGIEVLQLPAADRRVDLAALIRLLATRQINEVHVEAGAGINGSLVQLGLVDELIVYQAPMLIGHGLGMFGLPLPTSLDATPRLTTVAHGRLGEDLWLRMRPRTNCMADSVPDCRPA
jgi:diaminohydroxyphosphoribosylaminopyrimidine deaminase/5-amino-6-(5-phosphoribosylamino)uracil reductase